MPGETGIFCNRQDGFDESNQEFDDLGRPRRDEAAERCALEKRAGHVTVPSGRGRKNMCPAAAAPGTLFPILIFPKSHAYAHNVKDARAKKALEPRR
jgi:hypothetical protein